jgi:exopolysaccharide production protein ExoQ
MSATVSIFVAVFFLAFFARNDSKEYPMFATRLWLPLIWMLLTSTRLFEIIFPSQSAENATDTIAAYLKGNATERGISIAFICMGLIALSRKKIHFGALAKANSWLFLLYFYALISIGWSDFPGVSFKRWIRIIGSLIMALIMLVDDDPGGAFEHIFRRYASFCLIFSVILVKFYPKIGFVTSAMGTRSWAGIASHKNELAIFCSFALVFFVWRFLKSRPSINAYDIILVLMCLYLLMRTGSATADVTVLLALLVLFIITFMKGNLKKVIIFTLALSFIGFLIVGIFLEQPQGGISGAFFRAAGRESTLTGRVPIWEYVLKLGNKDLIAGAGYESFWMANLLIVRARFAFGPNTAHSGYVDIILSLGIIGLAILIILIFKSIARLVKSEYLATNYGRIIFVFFIMALLRNITESSMMNLSLSWFLFLLCTIRVINPLALDRGTKT